MQWCPRWAHAGCVLSSPGDGHGCSGLRLAAGSGFASQRLVLFPARVSPGEELSHRRVGYSPHGSDVCWCPRAAWLGSELCLLLPAVGQEGRTNFSSQLPAGVCPFSSCSCTQVQTACQITVPVMPHLSSPNQARTCLSCSCVPPGDRSGGCAGAG